MARAPSQKSMEALPESDCLPGAIAPRITPHVFGHEEAERSLLHQWARGRLPQTLVFRGMQGIGKATLAWRLTKFLLAWPAPARHPEGKDARTLDVPDDHPVVGQVKVLSHPDVIVLRRAWNSETKKFFTEISAENVRAATGLYHFSAGSDGARVIVLDSLEDLNTKGANALLKTIEEPPPNAYFFMIAHQGAFMLPTIRSRAQVLTLHPLADEDMQHAVRQQGKAPLSPEELARAKGCVRAALQMLMPDSGALRGKIHAVLASMAAHPGHGDGAKIVELAHQLSSSAALDDYQHFLLSLADVCSASLHAHKGASLDVLQGLAEAYAHIEVKAREVDALNLDKTGFVIGACNVLCAALGALNAAQSHAQA